jgi:hypothetical protein
MGKADLRRYLHLILAAALLAAGAAAQSSTGALRGVLTDESGGVIPAAAVEVTGGGVHRTAQTQADGSYAFPALPPGEYAVRVSYPGFSTAEKTASITAGGTVNLPISLTITAETQKVEVQADAGPAVDVQPDNNATAMVLKGEDLDALPDNPDDLEDALQALAGPGAGPNGGSIYIDGFSGGTLPPKESIREVRINQNPFSAEFDHLGYGRIEILTRPGADKFRGALFLNSSDGVLNSRNPFSTNKPGYSSRMYGGNFGGPINKRASFFLDFNRRQINDNAVVYAPSFVDPNTLVTTPIQQSVATPSVRTRIAPRIDYQISANHTLTARFEGDTTRRENLGVGGYQLPPPYASLGYNSRGNEQEVMLTETAVLNARTINETRFQFARDYSRSLGSTGVPTVNVAGAFTIGGNQTGNAYSTSHHYELQNNTSLALGTHTIRWGVRLRRTDNAANSPSGYGGTFSFLGGIGPVLTADFQPVTGPDGQPQTERLLAVDQYVRTIEMQRLGYSPDQIRALGGGASRFTINAGNPYASVAQFDAGPWVQDDWRLRPNLTLSLGLRYEVQTNVSDYGDIAPRIGFAWAPGSARNGHQKTVIRGGFGMFYDRVSSNLVLNARRQNGVNQLSYVVDNPDFYPAIPALSSLTPRQNSIMRLDPGLRAAYSMQSAIGVERQLPRNTTFAITYTNTRANHLIQTVPINAPLPGTYPIGDPDLGLRPFGSAGNLFEYQSGGLMKQHLLMANFNTRFSRAISLFGNYTLSYAKDLPGQPTDPYNFQLDWGRSQLDRRHRFQLAGSIAAPLGLRLNPFLILQSGSPYDVLLGTDLYGVTWVNARPAFASEGGPDTICKPPYGCFTTPVPGSALNVVPRNYLTSAGLVSVNLRIGRTFGFGSRHGANDNPMRGGGFGGPGGPGGGPRGGGGMRMGGGMRGMDLGGSSEQRYTLTISAMVTNVLNHVNPSGYQGNINSPQFGEPTSVNTGFGGGPGGGGPGGGGSANNRRVEFQARFNF